MRIKKWKRFLAAMLCALMIFSSALPVMATEIPLETVAETIAESGTEVESTAESEIETEEQSVLESEDETEGESALESEIETEEKSASESESEIGGETEAESESETEVLEETLMAADDTAAGFFYLSAVTLAKTLIEPVKVEYTQGQTVKEALISSGYEFSGIDAGYIHSIEGEAGSFSIFMSDGGYDIARQANEVSVVAFAEGELYSEAMVNLIIRMGEYNEMTNNVQKYAKAAEAYKNALDGLAVASASSAAELLSDLNAAIAEYEALFSGEKVLVTINAVQGGMAMNDPLLAFTDVYGNETTATGTTISLLPGDYDFVVSDGGYNRTEGSINVTDTVTLSVELPSGEWFGDIKILRLDVDADGNKIPYEYVQDKEAHKAQYYIDDTASKTASMYLNALKGADVLEGTELRTIYMGLNGSDYSDDTRTWGSTSTSLTQLIEQGMTGRTFALEAQYTGDDGYVMIQSYEMTLIRVPTLTSIVLRDGNGTSLFSGYDSMITEYTVNTINDTIDVETETYGKTGYTVTVESENKVTDTQAEIYDGENKLTVTVSHTNGQSRTYNFTIVKTEAAFVTMKPSADVTVEIQNANGNVIEPKETNVYELVPGQIYTYIGTKLSHYHSSGTFTAIDQGTVIIADPIVETALQDFVMYDNSSSANRQEVAPDQAFNSAVYEYTFKISDANSALYVQASKASGYTVTARYNQQSAMELYHGVFKEQNVSRTVGAASVQALTRSIMTSGYGNVVTLRVWKTSEDVTYYQDYTLNIQRVLHLSALEASADSGVLTFMDAENQRLDFDRDVLEYYTGVSSDTEKIYVNASFMNEDDTNELCGGYYAMINGIRYDSLTNIEFSLDVTKEVEDLEIQVCHENGLAAFSTYTLHVKKQEPVAVTFEITPQESIVFVVNEVDGRPIYANNGIFELMPGIPYTYTVTSAGYISLKVTGLTLEEKASETIKIELESVPVNESVKELEAQWPSFRDENNNAIVEAETPISDEETVLYWANEIGVGTGSGATGCPIIVDDYLYVYAGTSILKVDAISGEIIASGEMAGSSSFAINTPTYGGGMIFVGLSNGRVQAFNASTLESLWLYTDDLKGQPNCSITYKDGYIYTGFWNSETKDANYVCIAVADEDPSQMTEGKTASWVYTKQGGFYWAGAYTSDNFMLVGTDDGEGGYSTGYAHLVSIDPMSGKVLDDLTLPHTGDLRCNITYDADGTGDYYFTTKGGYFYGISVNADGTFVDGSLKYVKLENGTSVDAMSTSTPTIYKGRAYVGVAGSGQFSAYSGHNISVIDLARMKVAYTVPTQGYPQTSGIVTNAYEANTGKVYVYFFDNYTPGKLRVFSDQPGQTKLFEVTEETVNGVTYETGYVLFTPYGSQAEYAICSPVVDEYGTIYFKNDSAQLMALGATLEKIEVTKLPETLTYAVGDTFDPAGIEVVATYTNGKTRDITNYISYSAEPLTENDSEFAITFEHVMYQNKDGQAGVEYTAPMTFIELTLDVSVEYVIGKIDEIGEVTVDKTQVIMSARNAYELLSDEEKAQVTNYDILAAAEEKLDELLVPDLIAKIDAIGDVTLEKEEAIMEARTLYDALSDKNKALVTNYETLTSAEAALAKLKEEAAVVKVTGVKLNKSTVTMTKPGDTVTLKATISPSDATDKAITWQSSNTKVAAVDENGVVTAVGYGTTNITAVTKDGSKKATCKVTVDSLVGQFVTRLYSVCLGRTPDAAGKADWVNRLETKQITGIGAAHGFVFSLEFKNKNLCNEDYVEQLYLAFMGRNADATGRQYWVKNLESGMSREEVFNGFALSTEFNNLCTEYGIEQGTGIDIPKYGTIPEGSCSICGKEDGVTLFVKRLYSVCLGRDADAAGLKDWTTKLRQHTASGRQVAYGFIFSKEFTDKNYSNQDYVEYLYKAFMGRDSDPAGKADWVNRLNKGWTRQQVFDGFSGSIEFTNICNSYGILRD